MFFAFDVAKRHLQQAQRDMKGWYDKKARTRSFAPGDQVLVFLPIPGQPLCAKFVGPYKVESKLGDLNYLISTPDRRKGKRVCHINMLKPYFDRETAEHNPLVFPMATVVRQTEGKTLLDSNKDRQSTLDIKQAKVPLNQSCSEWIQCNNLNNTKIMFYIF